MGQSQTGMDWKIDGERSSGRHWPELEPSTDPLSLPLVAALCRPDKEPCLELIHKTPNPQYLSIAFALAKFSPSPSIMTCEILITPEISKSFRSISYIFHNFPTTFTGVKLEIISSCAGQGHRQICWISNALKWIWRGRQSLIAPMQGAINIRNSTINSILGVVQLSRIERKAWILLNLMIYDAFWNIRFLSVKMSEELESAGAGFGAWEINKWQLLLCGELRDCVRESLFMFQAKGVVFGNWISLK